MDLWGKIQTIAVSVSAIASGVGVPIILAVLGYQYNAAIKEREAQSKFVELAVSILVLPPEKESRLLRTWATEVVNRYSGVKLAEDTRAQLIDKLSLPAVLPPTDTSEIYAAMLKGGGTATQVRPLLAELGYYVAPLTSDAFQAIGRTSDALRKFQLDRGLSETGSVNPETLEALTRAVREKRERKDDSKPSDNRNPKPSHRNDAPRDGGTVLPLDPRY